MELLWGTFIIASVLTIWSGPLSLYLQIPWASLTLMCTCVCNDCWITLQCSNTGQFTWLRTSCGRLCELSPCCQHYLFRDSSLFNFYYIVLPQSFEILGNSSYNWYTSFVLGWCCFLGRAVHTSNIANNRWKELHCVRPYVHLCLTNICSRILCGNTPPIAVHLTH